MKNGSIFPRRLLRGAFKKYMKPSLEALDGFLKNKNLKIDLFYIDTDTKERETYQADIKVVNSNSKPGISFEISIKDQLRNGGVKYLNSYGLQDSLRIYNNKFAFVTDAGAVENFECTFPKLPRKLTGNLNNLRTQQKRYDKSYFRMCIPVTDGDIIYPVSIVESDQHLVFDVPRWDMQPSLIGIRFPSIKGMCVKLRVRERCFHFYAIEDIKSVFIDSLERLTFDEFQSIVADIRLVFAFLTAKYYSGDVFTLMSKDKNFRRISDVAYRLEDSPISGKQQLINPTQLFQFYRDVGSDEIKRKFDDFHTRFPVEIFNACSTLLQSNPVLRRAIEILVSSCSTKQPLQQGILGSVALETITELITDENESVIKPIPNRQIARALIRRFNMVLTEEFENVPPDGLSIIRSKLADLNKPTNKGKLLFPFRFFGINLSKADEETLNYRNDFLHGRSPTDLSENWKLEQIALQLHYLTGIVILKYIGYSGHVINLPSWNLFSNEEKMVEKFPLKNERMAEIVEKIKQARTELSEDDLKTLKVAEDLSVFIESLITLI